MNSGNDRMPSCYQIKLRAFENLLKLIVAESHSHSTNIENDPCIIPKKICSPSGF